MPTLIHCADIVLGLWCRLVFYHLIKTHIIMKSIFFSLFFCLMTVAAFSQSTTYVNGYYKTDGTYVSGHYKTVSNSTNWDNYSTQGNTNPYTLEAGSKPRDYSSQSYASRSNKTIYTGPRGGKYYINSRGTRTYVPK